jgi:hypothetical protein
MAGQSKEKRKHRAPTVKMAGQPKEKRKHWAPTVKMAELTYSSAGRNRPNMAESMKMRVILLSFP